jgi:hypothetical protein
MDDISSPGSAKTRHWKCRAEYDEALPGLVAMNFRPIEKLVLPQLVLEALRRA